MNQPHSKNRWHVQAPRLWRRCAQGHHRLGREIALILVLKAIALWVIWAVWFSQPQSKQVDGGTIGQAVFSDRTANGSQQEDSNASRHGSR